MVFTKVKKCVICGKEFIPQKNGRQMTCSPECLHKQTLATAARFRRRHGVGVRCMTHASDGKYETVRSSCSHRDCAWRGKFGGEPCCDYFLENGEPRGSSPSECSRYVKGPLDQRKWDRFVISMRCGPEEEKIITEIDDAEGSAANV